ncbi:MAG: adenine phosphoribosyltransferase [Candidatus Kerfeldbacteria bacterium]
MDLKQYIREVPDWPKEGINFKDITTLLQDKEAFAFAVDELCRPYVDDPVDVIAGIDARGFVLAAAMAYKLGTGIALVRKAGKLPAETVSREYALEYGSNTIEMHKDAVKPGQKVLMVDDLLATGGTMAAAIELVKELGGEIAGVEFIVELDALNGREKFKDYKTRSLVHYKYDL